MTQIEEASATFPSRRATGSAVSHAYTVLRDSIVSMRTHPGEIITEEQVAKRLSMSRTPVREAFLWLERERLVDIRARVGAVVTPISVAGFREFSETRFMMEAHSARQICRKRIVVGDHLGRLIDQQAEQLEEHGDSVEKMIKTDVEFHTTVVRLVGNSELDRVYTSLGERQRRFGIALFSVEPQRPVKALRMHRQIIDSLSRFDEDGVLSSLEEHIMGMPEDIAIALSD